MRHIHPLLAHTQMPYNFTCLPDRGFYDFVFEELFNDSEGESPAVEKYTVDSLITESRNACVSICCSQRRKIVACPTCDRLLGLARLHIFF